MLIHGPGRAAGRSRWLPPPTIYGGTWRFRHTAAFPYAVIRSVTWIARRRRGSLPD